MGSSETSQNDDTFQRQLRVDIVSKLRPNLDRIITLKIYQCPYLFDMRIYIQVNC